MKKMMFCDKLVIVGCVVPLSMQKDAIWIVIVENEEVVYMSVSYNGLWKLLIDKNKKKVDLINELGISSSTIAKMTKGEKVSMTILEKICDEMDCDFGDIIHYEKDKDGGNHGV